MEDSDDSSGEMKGNDSQNVISNRFTFSTEVFRDLGELQFFSKVFHIL